MDKKKILIIGGIVAVAGIAYYLYSRRKNKSIEVGKSSDANATLKIGTPSESNDSRYSAAVAGNLNWIQNKRVASYLSGLLSAADATKLRTWIGIIKKERAADPTKWGDANDLTGEKSDIFHALFQMNKKDSKVPFNNEVKFALQDA